MFPYSHKYIQIKGTPTMTLFDYDLKHERILGNLDLGQLTTKEMSLINEVVEFIEQQIHIDNYRVFMLENSFIVEKDKHTGERKSYSPK